MLGFPRFFSSKMPRILPGKWGKERRGGQRKPAKLEQAKLKASPPFRIPARNASSPQMCRPSTALGCVQLGSTSIPSRKRGGGDSFIDHRRVSIPGRGENPWKKKSNVTPSPPSPCIPLDRGKKRVTESRTSARNTNSERG